MNIIWSINSPMISGSGEIQARVFQKIQGKKHVWYVAYQDNAADNVYVVTKNKEGMAGRTLQFKLKDGTIEDVEAPWHSCSDALLEDTGIDIEDTHLISFIISERREKTETKDYFEYEYINVLIDNRQPSLMRFDEPKEKAQELANKLNTRVCLTMKTGGGGSMSSCTPKEVA